MKHSWILLLAALGASAAGCTNGFSGDAPPATGDTLKPDGLYSGTLTLASDPNTSDSLFVALAETGEMAIYNVTQNLLSVAVSPYVKVSGDSFSSDLAHYQAGSTIASGTISGTGMSRAGLSGTITGGDRPGTFSLTYETALYEVSSSFDKIAGSYTSGSGSSTISLTISSNGGVGGSATTSNGSCTLSGQISLLDTTRNLYHVDRITTACTNTTTNFVGLAVIQPPASAGGHQQLNLALASASSKVSAVISFTDNN